MSIPIEFREYNYEIRAVSVHCYKLILGKIENEIGDSDIIYLHKFDYKRKLTELMHILPFLEWWNMSIDKNDYNRIKSMIYKNGGCVYYNRFKVETK